MKFVIITKRHLVVAMSIVLGATIIAVGAFSFNAFAKTDRQIPIYCVESDTKKVALSFDAAWGNSKKVQNIKLL